MNHDSRSTNGRQGRALAERLMSSLAGRAGIRIQGQIVQWDSLKAKRRLHIDEDFIPVTRLIEHLTPHEIAEIENLPRWDGANEWQIGTACLRIVGAAIRRHKGTMPSHYHGDPAAVSDFLAHCRCAACSKRLT